MEDHISALHGLIEGRNTLLQRILLTFRKSERLAVYNQFMLNERMYLEVMFRTLNQTQRNQNQVVLTIPTNFLDSVPVMPTQREITNAIETIEGTNGNCAICQETITSDGSRIRHCGHTYHRSCIESWFLLSVRCPVCRHDIREQGGPSSQTSSDVE